MTDQEKKSSMESVSESYRSRGAAFVEDTEDGVDTEQVQKMSASEHAGGRDADGELREPVVLPEEFTPNTVNEGAENEAATRPADEHQPDSGAEDPTVLSDGDSNS